MVDGQSCCTCGGIQPAPRRGVVDLYVNLSTLMCLDDNPALIPGWGPVIADIARQVAHDQEHQPGLEVAVTDDDGNLLHHGHTRRRPTAAEKAFIRPATAPAEPPAAAAPPSGATSTTPQRANGGPAHPATCAPCAATTTDSATNTATSSPASTPTPSNGTPPTGASTPSSPTAPRSSPTTTSTHPHHPNSDVYEAFALFPPEPDRVLRPPAGRNYPPLATHQTPVPNRQGSRRPDSERTLRTGRTRGAVR